MPLTHEEIQYQLFFGCPFGMSSVMLRSEPFKRTGIRFRECMAEDYQLWVDLSEHLRMANIPEYLTFYRRWEDQISTRQLDRQTLSAQLTQQEQLARKLGVRLSDDEARIFTRFSLRTGDVKKRELASYRRILTRLGIHTIPSCSNGSLCAGTKWPADSSIRRGGSGFTNVCSSSDFSRHEKNQHHNSAV